MNFNLEAKIERATGVLYQAYSEYAPIRHFALFSGGNDSITSTHMAMENGAHEVVHVNTGIGIKQTREFVRDVVATNKWPFRELHPPQWSYRDMVLRKGFPGPGGHIYAYSWLKNRALRKLLRDTKAGHSRRDRVTFITGVRSTESARRMGHVEPIFKEGAMIWTAPLFMFDKVDVEEYKKANKLPTNPVSKILGMSGECLCGAFAQPGEIKKLEKHFPEFAAEIHALEDEAKAAGKHCVWGTRPPRAKNLNQYDIPFMPLCSGCPVK